MFFDIFLLKMLPVSNIIITFAAVRVFQNGQLFRKNFNQSFPKRTTFTATEIAK